MNPENSFHLPDQHGYPVILVELKAGENDLQEQRHIEILTPEGILLAKCEASGDEFQLFRSTGKYFATLAPDVAHEALEAQSHPSLFERPRLLEGPRAAWTVRTPSGSEWYVRGHFESYIMEVTDPQGRVLALSQPEKPTWKIDGHGDAVKVCLLRVAPLMDVSIVLCSLIAVC